MCSLAQSARKRVKNEFFVEHSSQYIVNYLMNQPVLDRRFANMALLGIGNIKMRVRVMLISQGYKVVLELKNIIF